MGDMTNPSRPGPSPLEHQLLAHLTSHVEAERGLLEQYTKVAQHTDSDAFRYLVNLLIEDETRHHRIFTELADSLRTAALLGGEKPFIPYLDFDRANAAQVIAGTQKLLENEERDARELKQLQHELRDVRDTTLWSLLVDLMQRDTQKHIAILRFVRKHTRRSKLQVRGVGKSD